MGDVSPNSSPPPMPLAKAPQPIVLPQGPHSIVLAPPFFLCIIMISTLIPLHPVRASQAYELTVPSMHVESMSRSPLHSDTPCFDYGAKDLCILVWHTIRGDANLFKLIL